MTADEEREQYLFDDFILADDGLSDFAQQALTRRTEFVEHLLVASTHSYLLIFTNRGRVFWLKIYEIPDASTTGKGKNINNLINLQPDETVKAFLAVKDFVADQFICMVTKHGVIKKSELTEFDNPMSRGIIAVGLDEGDELISAKITHGDNYIFLGSHEGQAIRFAESQVRPMGRPARGVRAMDLAEGDYLIGMEVVENRFADVSKADGKARIADEFLQGACIVGPEIADWQSLDLAAIHGRSSHDGKELAAGPGSNVMGHPLTSLAWLANQLLAKGKTLRAGDVILTGSTHPPQFLAGPGAAVSEFVGIGETRVRFE